MADLRTSTYDVDTTTDPQWAFAKPSKESKDSSPPSNEQLADMPWYFGDMDRTDAEKFLCQLKEDSFLVRNSSLSNHYAISLYTFNYQTVLHVLVKPLEYGQRFYQMEEDPHVYSSIPILISKSAEIKKYKPAQRPADFSLTNKTTKRTASISITPKPPPAKVFDITDGKLSDIEYLSDQKVKVVNEEAQRALLLEKGGASVRMTTLLKNQLKHFINAHEKKLQEYDKKLMELSMINSNSVQLSPEDTESYLKYLDNLNKLKSNLNLLRLRGDEFKIIQKSEQKMFMINASSQILLCRVLRSSNPQDLIPQDMSDYAYFNINVVGSDNSVFEITCTHTIHYIDQLHKIVMDGKFAPFSGVTTGGLVMYWKNGKTTTFNATFAEDSKEIYETVNAHLRRYSQASLKQIHLLKVPIKKWRENNIKDIYQCKCTKYEGSVPEHEKLLKRLWFVIKPNEPTPGSVDNQWKQLGFQGNNPSTDFRGMGLLGLLNLIYFAEHYTSRVVQMIEADREFPWAVTGINITNMLLNLFAITKELVNQPAPNSAWHTPLLTLFYYADNEDTFDELYSHAFLLFEGLWVHLKAGYMDFPTVIEKLKLLLEDLLKRKPMDIKQLIAWMQQLELSYTTRS